MVSRARILLLLVALLAATLLAIGGVVGDPAPLVSVENEDDVTYSVTAYTLEDPNEAGFLNFEVTTKDGERRLVTLADLDWPSGHENVTLVDDGVDRHEMVVPPNETATTTLEGWERGDLTIYVVEAGENRTHTSTSAVTCTRRGQEHEYTLDETGGLTGTTVCSGGSSWLFR